MNADEEMVLAGGFKCDGIVRVFRMAPRLRAIERLAARGYLEPLEDHEDGDMVLVYRLTPNGMRAASTTLKAA
jgi:hypothetical protein